MREEVLSLPTRKRRTLTLLAALLVAMVALFALGISAAETQAPPPLTSYVVQDLGNLSGNSSNATDINDSGKVVGSAGTSSGFNHAFLYDGQMQDLSTLGGNNSYAYGINDSDKVVGWAETSVANTPRAFLYDGQMHELGTLNGFGSSWAYDINDSDKVVGESNTGSGGNHAFLYDGVSMRDLGTLSGNMLAFSSAQGINDSDKVVGRSQTFNNSPYRAFLYDGVWMRDLGTLGGLSGSAQDISDSDKVVGWSQTRSGYTHAFLYDGQMRDLGTLGGNNSYAYGINDSDKVVGSAETGSGARHAFIYDNGQMHDLNALIPQDSGWTIAEASDINSDGQIAAYSDSNRALLLTPDTRPTPPSTPDLHEQSDSGASNTDNLTNDDTPTFTGTAEEGSTVKIYVDGEEKGSDPATGGEYSVTTSVLDSGVHEITATATNDSGESKPSQKALPITIDKTPPQVEESTLKPQKNATGVPTTTQIKASFSEAVVVPNDNSWFTVVSQRTGKKVAGTPSYDRDSNTATLTLDSGATLNNGDIYTVTIKKEVTDEAGNAMGQDYPWRFTTAGPKPKK